MKPYDPSPVLKKLEALEKDGIDIKELRNCCPPVAVIQDAKDFKPYIMAALEQFKQIMDLDVKYGVS